MMISSKNILSYIEFLEERQLSTHNVIIATGEDILFEKYWEPFHSEFLHRMYSVTKSVVALGVGFAIQDGLISLDDPIVSYFPVEFGATNPNDENVKKQTIRNMLMMSTAKTCCGWFGEKTTDRVYNYFANNNPSREPGVYFEYDSCGSFILCALVERLTGKTFLEYMREKLFDKIGVSKEAYFLKCIGGHSWGDSALLCKPRDLLQIARFVMNGGNWNGKQLLSRKYLEDATSKLIDTNHQTNLEYDSFGYGYQIWKTFDNAFMFNGMGCQFAVCVPDKDLILIYNGDNQGYPGAQDLVIKTFFEKIVRNADDKELEPDPQILEALQKPRMLMTAKGDAYQSIQDRIQNAVFHMDKNPMGISYLSFHFDEDGGQLHYENDQGKKVIPFGMLRNVFGSFPQEGYFDDVGNVRTKGHYYHMAASGAWLDKCRLHLKIQIIDKYFGNMDMIFDFRDTDTVYLDITKNAEYFLDEYPGKAVGKREYFPDHTPIDPWFYDTQIPQMEQLGTPYILTEYGIKADGTIQTQKIQELIDTAHDNGGGVIVVPQGVFLTGALFFKQGVHLYLSEGAILRGSDDISDYKLCDTRIEGENCKYYSALINADGIDGFVVFGSGTIDGNGWKSWRAFWLRREWNPQCTNKDEQRPRLIYVSNSKNVLFADVKMINSHFWTNHIYRCDHVKYIRCSFASPYQETPAPSTDAIDIDACTDVLVKGCFFDVDDDGIALKGGKGPWADQLPDNGSNQRILIEDCLFEHCHGCLTCGSEAIHNRNIIVRNCRVAHPIDLLWLKFRPDTPQRYEYILFENITGKVRNFIDCHIWTQFFDSKGRENIPKSVARHITMRNCEIDCHTFVQNVGCTNQNCEIAEFTFEKLQIQAVIRDLPEGLIDGLKQI